MFGMGIAAVLILSLGYFLKVSADWSRGWMILWMGSATALIIFNHYLVSRFVRHWVASGFFARNLAISGSGEVAARMMEHLSHADANQRVLGVFDDLPHASIHRVGLAGGG